MTGITNMAQRIEKLLWPFNTAAKLVFNMHAILQFIDCITTSVIIVVFH